MDISLLRTFLEVTRTRHFGHAAENLCVTQSAVSARIKLIEEQLDISLFVRERNNIQLTDAGRRFVPYAEAIIESWNRARQDVMLTGSGQHLLAVGSTYGIWDIFLEDWLIKVHQKQPQLSLRTEACNQETVIRMLLDKALDLGFLFEPPQMNKLEVVEAGAIELVMVSSRPDISAGQAVQEPNYIMVDWGTAFAIEHARLYQDIPQPRFSMGASKTALAFLGACGGSAYLAANAVQSAVDAGQLHRVADAPAIRRSYYAIYHHQNSKPDLIKTLIKLD